MSLLAHERLSYLSQGCISGDRRMGRRLVKVGITLASIALSTALVSGCKKPEAKADAGPGGGAPLAMVTVAVAEPQDVPVYLEEIGKCTASEYVAIQPQVSGVVKEIN